MVQSISKENYNDIVLNSAKTVLLDFYADWCGPCKIMSPIIDQIAEEVGEEVIVGKINVDENQELAEEYGVMSIPTIVVRKNGATAKTFVGVVSKEEIVEAIK